MYVSGWAACAYRAEPSSQLGCAAHPTVALVPWCPDPCSLSNSEAHKATCNARAGSLVEIQRRLQEAANHAEGRLREADAACDKRLAAAEADAAKRLAAVETALAAAEKEKVLAAEERRGGDAALAAAEGARREAEVARATAEAELRFVREGKEAEIARWACEGVGWWGARGNGCWWLVADVH